MGQTLSEPITTKEITMCQSDDFRVASCAMQGWRVTMEDSHAHFLDFPADSSVAFFGVYDGHGGTRAAQFAGMHLHKKIIGNDHYQNKDFHNAIKSGFLELDEELKKDEEMKEQTCGTTAVTVLVKDGKIFCGNAGDSRAVLCQKGKAVPLSFDHKPSDPGELQRITNAGGWVDACRVNGYLALSRAIGDFIFKNSELLKPEEQIVTALPDVIEVDITDEHEFIVLACDGIWDVMHNQQVVGYCRKRLGEGATPEQVCEEIVDRCLAPDGELSGIGCDNMTIVLVCLMQGLSKDEYIRRLKRESLCIDNESLQNTMSPGFEFNVVLGSIPAVHSVQDDGDNSFEVLLGRTARDKPPSGDSSKSSDKFVTPGESPHQEENSESPPTAFEVIAPTNVTQDK